VKRAIVTGGAGFIGSHVVDALLGEGCAVTVVDDLSAGDPRRVAKEAELRELDIVDLGGLSALAEEVEPDAIFHLAAQASVVASVENPGRDCEVNVQGTLNVVEVAGRLGAPVVFTSTGGALYGDEAPMPTPEDRIPAPLSPYGASKWAGEAYVKTWSLSSGIPHAVCRLGNVYGPRQNPHGEAGVVAIFSDHLYTGRAPKLFGHGKPTRDYVYVGDVVKALLAASGKAGTYNVATSVETDVATVWRELQQAAERTKAPGAFESPGELEPELADLRPGELQHSCLDISLAERELGWRPEVPIAEGLSRTYEAMVEAFSQGES
jgi:UDP-glucose 4-epimerase